jgi:hypothetical protein
VNGLQERVLSGSHLELTISSRIQGITEHHKEKAVNGKCENKELEDTLKLMLYSFLSCDNNQKVHLWNINH